MAISVNIEKLISGRIVESERIEYKKGWNPAAIYRTICAFANDFENIGGGYIIVGVEEEKGRAKRPVTGIPVKELDNIQKKMIGYNKLINPYYAPKISIETIDKVSILVIWVPGGNQRPYEVPEDVTSKEKKYHYYIRKYSSTVQTGKDERDELISLTRQTPFDDRINTQASIDDISPLLVREYLQNVNSSLVEQIETQPLKETYRAMDLVSGPDELLYPKNIALMMFNYRPEKFFPYSRIEIVEFPNGLGDPTFFEKPAITGPVYVQIRQALLQLESVVLKERIHKLPDRPEAQRIWNYPYRALEEAIVNSMYHRSWEIREPVEIRILPASIEIINQGGPDRSAKLDDIQQGIIRNKRYRNRRIGDFLKELDMTEGRGTGIPIIRKEMAKNGSPEPRFETDENYSYFITTLPVHPAFLEDEDEDVDGGVNDSGGVKDGINGGVNSNGGVNGGVKDGIDDGVNNGSGVKDGINGGVKDGDGGVDGGVKDLENQGDKISNLIYGGVNGGVKEIVDVLLNVSGLNAFEIATHINKSLRTTERYLQVLRKNEIVEFRGIPKTGGYYLTDKAKETLK
jgi:ATP-dependent DNA helicase RecG